MRNSRSARRASKPPPAKSRRRQIALIGGLGAIVVALVIIGVVFSPREPLSFVIHDVTPCTVSQGTYTCSIESGDFQFHVADREGNVVAAATVTFFDTSGATVTQTASEGNGIVTARVNRGTYDVTIEKQGYSTLTRRYTLTSSLSSS